MDIKISLTKEVLMTIFLCAGIVIGYFFALRLRNLLSIAEKITGFVPDVPAQGFFNNGKIFFWNRASEVIYGYPRREIINKNIFNLLIPEEDKEHFKQMISLCSQKGNATAPRERIITTKSGQKLTVYTLFFPIMRLGRCVGTVLLDVDISGLKKYEEELIFEKENYRAIFNGLNIGIAVYDPVTAKFAEVNNRWLDLFGYTVDNVPNLKIEDLIHGEKQELQKRIKETIAKVFYEGVQVVEIDAVSYGGRIFPSRVILRKAVINKREYILAMGDDITKEKEDETALKKSEMRYRTIISLQTELICRFDTQGNINFVNEFFARYFDKKANEFDGRNFEEMVFTEDKQKFRKSLKILIPGDSDITVELRMLNPDNKTRRHLWSFIAIFDENNRPVEYQAVGRDVTDRSLSTEELIGAEEKYRLVFNSMQDAIHVIDGNWKVILFNDAFKELHAQLGLPSDILGKDWREVYPFLPEKIRREYEQVFEEGKILDGEECIVINSKMIFTFTRKIPVFEGKKVSKIVTIVRDVTVDKKREEALRKSEELYRMLFENVNDLIVTINKEGFITGVNEAANRMTGFAEKEILGKHYSFFLADEDKKKGNELFNRVMSGAIEKQQELRILSKDGQKVFVMFDLWPFYDKEEKICGLRGIAKDVTEIKNSIEQMRQMIIQIISMLSQTISVADRYTEEHCERLAEVSMRVGKKLHLSETQLENLKFAALLHDVGKVGIPINILIKAGKLTEEEWNKIREHPKKGADIVRNIRGFAEVAKIIEQHQERADGKGYPNGLNKSQIKIEAAIISVVDAFDAMTSDRPYRRAMSVEEAIDELRKNAGSQFDEDVVKAFIIVLESDVK